jgi:holo-[acyl-carrier-protein] synthase
MIRGLGLDLCEIGRMEKLITDERFLNRYFNEGEIGYIRTKGRGGAQTMAGIYAAKEALAKALGTGIAFDLKEISIFHDEAGQPGYSLSGEAEKLGQGDRFHLSITHDGGIAAAVCIREDNH